MRPLIRSTRFRAKSKYIPPARQKQDTAPPPSLGGHVETCPHQAGNPASFPGLCSGEFISPSCFCLPRHPLALITASCPARHSERSRQTVLLPFAPAKGLPAQREISPLFEFVAATLRRHLFSGLLPRRRNLSPSLGAFASFASRMILRDRTNVRPLPLRVLCGEISLVFAFLRVPVAPTLRICIAPEFIPLARGILVRLCQAATCRPSLSDREAEH